MQTNSSLHIWYSSKSGIPVLKQFRVTTLQTMWNLHFPDSSLHSSVALGIRVTQVMPVLVLLSVGVGTRNATVHDPKPYI